MRRRILRLTPQLAVVAIAFIFLFSASARAHAQRTSVTKWRYDLGNTGYNDKEAILSPASLKTGFGKQLELNLDGQVYAQPLYMSNVVVPGKGTFNVVYIATEHNSIYAYDADDLKNTQPLWVNNLGPAVPTQVVGCFDLYPEYGITSTPVIDPSQNAIFVVSKTLERFQQVWRIHALDLGTGDELPGWGRTIDGGVVNSFGNIAFFDPNIQLNRCGLVINNGRVYVGFGSHCDIRLADYHGWVFAYSTTDPYASPNILCSTPDSTGDRESAAGIWSAGASPTFDDLGNMYIMTGNGFFDLDLGGPNMGDSVTKIHTDGGTTFRFGGTSADFFTPSNQLELTQVDADLGSGGLMALPTLSGTSTPHLVLGGGKDAILRVIDRDNMGGFNGRVDHNAPNNVVQEIGFPAGFWSTPGYFSSSTGKYVYMNSIFGSLRQFKIGTDASGKSKLTQVASSAVSTGYPSSSPVITSNGTIAGSGLVWMLNRQTGALHAFDAENVANEVWNSEMNAAKDRIGSVIKFTVPLVVNGRVFVGADYKYYVYSLDSAAPPKGSGYVIVGPNVFAKNASVPMQVSSLDANGNLLASTAFFNIFIYQADGTKVNNGVFRFGGTSNKMFSRKYSVVGPGEIVAAEGTDKEARFKFTVKEIETTGVDHFFCDVAGKVAAGVPFGYSLVAKDKADKQVNYTGTVKVTFTREDGTIAADQPDVVFNNQKVAFGTATLGTFGNRIMIATDGTHTGTAVIFVKDPVTIKVKVGLQDWGNPAGISTRIQLLDPTDHSRVTFVKIVALDSSGMATVSVPDGTFDVAVKPDRWLQQIVKGVATATTGTISFTGQFGSGLLNGDTNGDNSVDDLDIANVSGDLGGPPSGSRGLTDLNGDAIVNAADLAIANKNKGSKGDK